MLKIVKENADVLDALDDIKILTSVDDVIAGRSYVIINHLIEDLKNEIKKNYEKEEN